jgi:hypothetical protein
VVINRSTAARSKARDRSSGSFRRPIRMNGSEVTGMSGWSRHHAAADVSAARFAFQPWLEPFPTAR